MPVTSATDEYEKAKAELAAISIGPTQTLRQVLRRVTETSSAALGVNRVSVWRLVVDGRILMCEYLHQGGQLGVYEGAILFQKDFPTYFKALENKAVISIADVDGEPHVEEFREPYLKPLGIASMLDAPMFMGDEICGVVCHESVGAMREWTPGECGFAGYVAATISRLYGEWVQRKMAHAQLAIPERAQALDKMVIFGRMAAGMAHDFKNFLSVIAGYADLIAGLPDDASAWDGKKIKGFAEEILGAAGQGERLSRDLMALGNEEASKPEVVDLRPFLSQKKNILAMGIKPGMELIVDAKASVSRVFLDLMPLERALPNLVINASNAMPQGGRITLSLFETDRPDAFGDTDRYVALQVADQGTGMPKEVQQRIFEPYFTTKGNKGTGLGMAIVKQIISSVGGLLEIESEPDRGTTIRILLPRIANSD